MSLNKKNEVGVIIPVRNEERNIIKTIEFIAFKNVTPIRFIIVDDASSDNTVGNVKAFFKKNGINGIIVENEIRQGAGNARNIGLTKLKDVDYVMFFDSDDRMFPGAIDALVRGSKNSGSDVVIGKYEHLYGKIAFSRGMSRRDEEIWDGILGRKYSITFNLSFYGEFLETVNYPWNKLLRYDFIKKINLRFSDTVVHNDIFAHWFSLLSSNHITLVDITVCEHKVQKKKSQITNISDERRLSLFKALNEVDNLLIKNLYWKKKYYNNFLKFKLELVKWAYNLLENYYKEQFVDLFLESIINFDMETFSNLAESYPKIAADYAFMKYRLKEL